MASASAVDYLWRIGLWFAYRMLLGCWWVFRPRRRGVFIGVWHRGRLLVIRNSYRRFDALPAGGLKRGETPREAAARELAEEVGIAVAPEALRFVAEIPTTFEFKRDRCSFFELELAEEPRVEIDRREVVWAGFLSAEEALAGCLAPPVRAYLDIRRGIGRTRSGADRIAEPGRSE